MRTRRSNRQKRYFTETFDLGEGSDDSESSALPRRARVVEEDDENFAAPDNESAADQDDDEDEGEDEDADDDKLVVESDSDSSVSGVEGIMRPASRIRDNKSIRASTARLAGVPQYLNITPFPPENQLPRGYAGYFDRNVRGRGLVRAWYGPDPKRMEIAARLLERWGPWKLLPPKEAVPNPDRPRKGVWSSDIFEREMRFVERWLERLRHDRPPGTSFSYLSLDESHPYRLGPGAIPVLIGPSDSQAEIRLSSGGGVAITQHGLPFEQDEDPDKVPSGWMVDTGGIVLNMEWASQRRNQTQLVAMVVIPYGDQEIYSYGEQGIKPDWQRHGIVQLWEFAGQRTSQNTYIPDQERMPSLYKTICTDRGRVRSIRWNPACNHLAVLCDGGAICVVDIDDGVEGAPFEKIETPIASFGLDNEACIEATAMAWVNVNRLAVGYSDGSIALWSVHPNCLISRHAIHHTPIIDMASGYPTMPYLIASNPMGGTSKLVDLRAPSKENTEVPFPAINVTPHLMSWSEHLLGFFTMTPTSNVLSTAVAFMHSTHYPVVRRVYTGDRLVSCIAVGRTHPFLLVGSVDGSIWAFNPQYELIHARRKLTDRIKVLQHEHRPPIHFNETSPAHERGASRILQGFMPEKSLHARSAETKAQKKKAMAKKAEEEDGEGDDASGHADPAKGILHEPLTRITAMAWNPNPGFGCWAAAAMGSGVVRVMDLGLDP